VGIYGHPGATKDIDFLIANDEKNLKKLQKALREFGTPEIDMSPFKEKGYVFRMGRSPIQIDIINDATGIDIAECYDWRGCLYIFKFFDETRRFNDFDIFLREVFGVPGDDKITALLNC